MLVDKIEHCFSSYWCKSHVFFYNVQVDNSVVILFIFLKQLNSEHEKVTTCGLSWFVLSLSCFQRRCEMVFYIFHPSQS